MRSWRELVALRLGHHSSCISLCNKLQSFAYRFYLVLSEIVYENSIYRILYNLQILRILFKKIVNLLIVNLYITHLEIRLIFLSQSIQKILKRQWNQTQLVVLFDLTACFSEHSKRLSSPCNPICKNSGVIPIDKIFDQRTYWLVKNIDIIAAFWKSVVKLEVRLLYLRLPWNTERCLIVNFNWSFPLAV